MFRTSASNKNVVRRPKVMGKLVVTGRLHWLGWASTIAMGFCIIGMVVPMFMGSAL